MAEHVLMFGSGPAIDYGARLRAMDETVTTTMVCRLDFLRGLLERRAHSGGPVLVVTRAQALHAVHPVTRVTSFWEYDQDRAAAVGAALGLAAHAVQTVRAVNDKDVMRE